jgi:hypothetical protein
MADSLLLDASLLLHAPTAREVRRAFEDEYVPSVGEVMVSDVIYRAARGDMDYFEPLAAVYGGQRRGAVTSPDDLAWVTESDIYPYTLFPETGVGDLDDALAIFSELTGGNLVLSRLLVDEWVFLTSSSWIAARTHNTFNFFKQAGAVAIELPKASFDELARRTLRIPAAPVPRPLKRSERLRAVSKWVAAGGASWAAVLDPLLGAVAGSVAGFFLLFDP